MKDKAKVIFTPSVFLSVSLLVAINPKNYPYIDPGTGSLILQILIGSLVGALFLVKVFWRRIRAFFKSLFRKGGRKIE